VIVNPSFPSGFVVFCDDVRQEVTGKVTMVGVYTGQMMLTGNLPVVLPQICAVTTFRLAPPTEQIKPIIRLFRSGQDEPLFEMEADIPAAQPSDFPPTPTDQDPDAVKFLQMIITAQVQNLVITEPCTLKVRAFVGDDEIRLGALQILVTPTDTVEPITTH
jgi:hypothetical protein